MAPLKSILLVDDNANDNLIHTFWLQRVGAVASRSDVIVRENGREALAFLQDWEDSRTGLGAGAPPSLILLDVHMPVMDGFEFLEALEGLVWRAALSETVVVMLTSAAISQDRARAMRSPWVRDYLEKPLGAAAIQALLRAHFANPSP